MTWKFKQDDETWEQYSARQTARIMLLENELDNYRMLIEKIRDLQKCAKSVEHWANDVIKSYERAKERDEK